MSTITLDVQSACISASSALATYYNLIFHYSGLYTNSSAFSAVSTSVVNYLNQAEALAYQLNDLPNATSYTHFGQLATALGAIFSSVESYSAAITSRDTYGIVGTGLAMFAGDAWLFLSAVNTSVTNCGVLTAIRSDADYLQSGMLALAQYNSSLQDSLQVYFPSIDFYCRESSNSTSTASAKVFAAPTTEETSDETTDVLGTSTGGWSSSISLVSVTTFSPETELSTSNGVLVCTIGVLGAIFAILL